MGAMDGTRLMLSVLLRLILSSGKSLHYRHCPLCNVGLKVMPSLGTRVRYTCKHVNEMIIPHPHPPNHCPISRRSSTGQIALVFDAGWQPVHVERRGPLRSLCTKTPGCRVLVAFQTTHPVIHPCMQVDRSQPHHFFFRLPGSRARSWVYVPEERLLCTVHSTCRQILINCSHQLL